MAGRPPGSPNKDKPFRDALRMEAALAEKGEPTPAKPESIRWAARQLLKRAAEDTASFREAADRMDGKVAQAHEHSGQVGTYDLTKVSDDDLSRLETILGPIAVAEGDQGGTEPPAV